ncbi:MAG: hypothetical protein ACFFCV_02490 [Promethearchaeota archaeon]
MAEEKSTKKKSPKFASKISFEDLLPMIEEVKEQKDVDKIIKLIPSSNSVLKNDVRNKLVNETLKDRYSVSDFNKNWKRLKVEGKKIKKKRALIKPIVDKLKKGDLIEEIKYDDSTIKILNNGIFFITKKWIGGELTDNPIEILDGKFEILYRVYDERNEKMLYTYKFNNNLYHTYDRKELISKLTYNILKGNYGIDVLKKVINYYDGKLEKRTAKPVLGFDNGWVLPIQGLEKEKEFAIISTNHYQRIAYKNAKKMYKEYSEVDKERLKKIMNKLIKKTKIKPVKQSIIIGWCIAAPFRKTFINLIDIFPPLNLIGERRSGKSAFFNLFTTIFYKIYENAFTSTDFASDSRISGIMTSSTFPAHFEEIKEVSKYTLSLLKESATNDFYRDRMSKDGVHIAQSVLMSTPIGTDANYFIKEFIDIAYNSKVINLFFDEKDIIPRDDSWLELRRKLKREKLFSFIYDMTKDWTNKDILEQIESIEKEYKKDIKFMDTYYPRLSFIFQIILFGIKLFEKAFDIILEKDDIITELTSSRQNLTNTILQLFYMFCQRARDYEEEIIVGKTEEGETVKYTKMKDKRYLNHKLEMNSKRDYDFTQENLGDFNTLLKTHGEEVRSLKGLAGELREALSAKDKDMIKYFPTTRDKKTISLIIIKNEFLPIESSYDKDEKGDIDDDVEIPGLDVEDIKGSD